MEPNIGATAFWRDLIRGELPTSDPARLAKAYRIPESWIRFWMGQR